ncbi:hypothetical protein PINS_up009973 [Pythium insidiosum]|nr:hypothetical protein PINS_up009973 [Pythium insidiosum]
MTDTETKDMEVEASHSNIPANHSVNDEAMEPMPSSQSCGSDEGDESGSESLSDRGITKRKQSECSSPSSESSDDEVATSKRAKVNETPEATGNTTPATSTKGPSRLLKFDQNNMPVHPQIVLQEQQLSVRQYMQEYIREYVDFIILQQVRMDPLALGSGSSSSIKQAETGAQAPTEPRMAHSRDIAVSSLSAELHQTPITLPSLANRVTKELAGSIQELLFSSNTTSPQSVDELFQASTRPVTKPVGLAISSPPSGDDAVMRQRAPRPTAVCSSPGASSAASSPASSPSSSTSSSQIDLPAKTRKLFTPLARADDRREVAPNAVDQ